MFLVDSWFFVFLEMFFNCILLRLLLVRLIMLQILVLVILVFLVIVCIFWLKVVVDFVEVRVRVFVDLLVEIIIIDFIKDLMVQDFFLFNWMLEKCQLLVILVIFFEILIFWFYLSLFCLMFCLIIVRVWILIIEVIGQCLVVFFLQSI